MTVPPTSVLYSSIYIIHSEGITKVGLCGMELVGLESICCAPTLPL